MPSMRFSAMPMLARVVAERAPASYHSLLMRAMSSMDCTGHGQPRTALIPPDSLRMCCTFFAGTRSPLATLTAEGRIFCIEPRGQPAVAEIRMLSGPL